MIGIYVHIPFCAKRCPYCDFYSDIYSNDSIVSYGKAVIRNLEYYSKFNVQADTLYFGGGTPSLMDINSIKNIVETATYLFNMPTNSEITLEANPKTLNDTKLNHLKEIGINRLSIGVQSCVDSELKTLGRWHTFQDCKTLVNTANHIGFTNISCDLMIGTPFQTMDSLEYSCNTLAQLDINHISSYMLKIENGTPYSRDNDILSNIPNDDIVSDMYLRSIEIFKSYGFNQYEISNFAKPMSESRHNLKYWKCIDYLGIGSGAHSCFREKRFYVPSDRNRFISEAHQSTVITEDNPYTFEEIVMLSLRLNTGLDTKTYPQHASSILSKAIPLQHYGYLTIEDGVITLTPKGFLVSNSIIARLI